MKERTGVLTKWREKSSVMSSNISVCFKCLIAVWALSGESLSLLLSGYAMEVPVFKYIFTVIEGINGRAIETIFVALGLGTVFYFVKDRQRTPWLSGLSAFFAMATVVGISYEKTGSWNCIFLFNTQLLFAVAVAVGYYLVYKNSILFIAFVFEKKNDLLRRDTRGKLEEYLFEIYPFKGALIFVLICGLPWLINFFPGTMQYDAQVQLFMDFGEMEKTGHFPVIMTEIMGACMQIGKSVFGSDNMGLFLFCGPQFLLQALVFSYAMLVMKRGKTPIMIRWIALVFWAIYPFFPVWGYTMVKDTLHYVCVLLLSVVLQDIIIAKENPIKWWQYILILFGAVGITISRNDGRYLVVITMLCGIVCYRKYWKAFVLSIAASLLVAFLVEGVYMPYNNIPQGSKAEMLSMPLQQTARYLKEHMDDVTDQEAEVLNALFTIPLEDVVEVYNPVLSDPVKGAFLTSNESYQLSDYFEVWFSQFLKHPTTYVQAFLNQTYGYFYPNMTDPQEVLVFFGISRADWWKDQYVDLSFAITNNVGRDILKSCFYVIELFPVISMVTSAGFHVYLLLGACVYLLAKKKRRELFILVPQLCVLLICIVSPVNAAVRYTLPIMVTLPVNLAWCYLVAHDTAIEKK